MAVFGGLGYSQEWKYVDKNAWDRNTEKIFDSYKFGSLAGTNDIRSISLDVCKGNGLILEKDEMMGEGGRFILFSHRYQAENFKTFVETKFAYTLIASTVRGRGNAYSDLLPDLSESFNPRTGLVGYESDWTDEDLKKLFEDVLTEEDWKYIEKVAVESDPAGAKR